MVRRLPPGGPLRRDLPLVAEGVSDRLARPAMRGRQFSVGTQDGLGMTGRERASNVTDGRIASPGHSVSST